MIKMILKEKKIGALYNLLTLHSQRLQIRKDDGDRYQMAKDILNEPKRFKDVIKKLESYEDQKI